jgi:outer membrane protein TolC
VSVRVSQQGTHRDGTSTATARNLLWAAVSAAVLCGCTAAHYRKSADREVYRVVQQVENRVFGRTNAFTIDTPYAQRKPDEILPAELINDRSQTNRRVLKIEDALRLAVSDSRRYQAEREKLYLTALTLTGSRYEFGPHFFAGTTGTLDRDSDGRRSAELASQSGVSQLLKSGGRLGATLANDLFRYYTGDPQRTLVSTISVNLVQPLLRGFGRNNSAVETLTQAERNMVYAVRDFSFFQRQFALEIVNDYFGLLAQKDNIRNRYRDYLGRAQSTKRLESRQDRERLVDVDQARQAELTSKNNYVNAVAAYQNSLDQFKIKLGLALGERLDLDDDALAEVGKTGLVPADVNSGQAYRLAVERQLEILNAIDRFEDSKRKIRVAADALKPGLDLTADASLESNRPTDYTRFDPDRVQAGVGLSLNLPLDRLRERNNYRATLVSFESQLRSLTLTLDTLKDSIDRGLRTLEQRRQNYQIQKNALELATRRVDSTTMMMEAGRAEARDMIEAQDAQLAAQNAVTVALVDYQEARLQLMLDVGALDTESPQFWLKDHLSNFLPVGTAIARQPDNLEKPLIPPDEFFKN